MTNTRVVLTGRNNGAITGIYEFSFETWQGRDRAVYAALNLAFDLSEEGEDVELVEE